MNPKIQEKRIRKDQICDKCSKGLKANTVVFYHTEKKAYKHKECPPEWVPQKNTKPTGMDLMLIVETFGPMHELIGNKGIDMLKYEEEELVKFFWVYKQYLRDKDKKAPF